jgi:hypothetical protein
MHPLLRLEPGFYTLEFPITNPLPDRRSSAWAKGEQLLAGTYKAVGHSLFGPCRIERLGSYQSILQGDPRYEALALKLVPKKILNLREIINEGPSSFDAETILVALFDTGNVTVEAIKSAKAHVDALDCKGVSEMFTKHGYSR